MDKILEHCFVILIFALSTNSRKHGKCGMLHTINKGQILKRDVADNDVELQVLCPHIFANIFSM